ncbi:unnamed protein product [Pleuronectes platessa]|uniref:Uncharacterized protein n=1 Tax=Pleuronectes platessa TaxID=8262 RepID=A0A9N7V374_PLEPL|nr:unnamed protein product [Pleuronectes platessa]
MSCEIEAATGPELDQARNTSLKFSSRHLDVAGDEGRGARFKQSLLRAVGLTDEADGVDPCFSLHRDLEDSSSKSGLNLPPPGRQTLSPCPSPRARRTASSYTD